MTNIDKLVDKSFENFKKDMDYAMDKFMEWGIPDEILDSEDYDLIVDFQNKLLAKYYGLFNTKSETKKLKELPQFDRSRHGSLYDRGGADSWYSRNPHPHWYPNGTGRGERIEDLTVEEINEYMQGYEDNEAIPGAKKEW